MTITRNALPQNYLRSAGVSLNTFQSAAEWSNAYARGTKADDTVNFVQGTRSVKLTITTPGDFIGIGKTISIDFSKTSKQHRIWFYLHNDPSEYESLCVFISSVSNMSKYFSAYLPSTIKRGWNYVALGEINFGNTGGDSWDNTMVYLRIRVDANPGYTPAVSFGSWTYGEQTWPRIIFHFDDARKSLYSNAYPIMAAKGFRGTTFVNPPPVKANNINFCSLANLQELYAAGWDIANHSWSHANMTGYTQAEVENEIIKVKDWLATNGFLRGSNHYAYPNGVVTDNTVAAAISTGMLTARTTSGTYSLPPCSYYHRLVQGYMQNTTTLPTVKGWVDTAIERGYTLILLFHDVIDGSTTYDFPVSDFEALCAYIAARRVEVVTQDEWYRGITDPRYRSLPLVRS